MHVLHVSASSGLASTSEFRASGVVPKIGPRFPAA